MKSAFIQQVEFVVLQIVAVLFFVVDRESIKVFSIGGIFAPIFLDAFADF